MEEIASNINDSQWKIGAFLTHSYANPKKFRSRKKKINFGLNQQPDCVVILKADRKSSVILEADRSQIPIAALVDSTIPWESYKRITYPIPANDPIQFVYLFRHSIKKTVILERPRITAMNTRTGTTHLSAGPGSGGRRYYASASHSSLRKKRSATGLRIILFQRRCVHTSELFLAVAPFLPEIADQVMDAIDQAAEQIETTKEQTDTSTKNLIIKEDLNNKLLDVERKRIEKLATNEYNTELKKMDPTDLPFELKVKEYDLFLGNENFYGRCLRFLKRQFPLLHERHARLAKNIPREERKLRCLLKYLLKRQDKEYTLKNLYILEKYMCKPDWLESVISPLLEEFINQRGRKK